MKFTKSEKDVLEFIYERGANSVAHYKVERSMPKFIFYKLVKLETYEEVNNRMNPPGWKWEDQIHGQWFHHVFREVSGYVTGNIKGHWNYLRSRRKI